MSEDNKLIIKKYPNRRLYNTETSKCVTLEELLSIIKQGRDIEVIDTKTGEDITPFILTQILVEQSRKHAWLPVSLLHTLIRYGDSLLSEFFEQYFEQVIQTYLNYRNAVDIQFKKWLELGFNLSKEASEKFLAQNPFTDLFNIFGGAKSFDVFNENKEQKDKNK